MIRVSSAFANFLFFHIFPVTNTVDRLKTYENSKYKHGQHVNARWLIRNLETNRLPRILYAIYFTYIHTYIHIYADVAKIFVLILPQVCNLTSDWKRRFRINLCNTVQMLLCRCRCIIGHFAHFSFTPWILRTVLKIFLDFNTRWSRLISTYTAV